jgi:hypothetical protein
VREGVTWFSWQGVPTLNTTVSVVQPQYGVAWGAQTTPTTSTPGATMTGTVSFTNTGSQTWTAGGTNAVHLGAEWRSGACPNTGTVTWNPARSVLAGDVPQGGVVNNLPLKITAPSALGTYCLSYDLVREGITWFSWQGVPTLNITVQVQ